MLILMCFLTNRILVFLIRMANVLVVFLGLEMSFKLISHLLNLFEVLDFTIFF
jgi:hypothetical protein